MHLSADEVVGALQHNTREEKLQVLQWLENDLEKEDPPPIVFIEALNRSSNKAEQVAHTRIVSICHVQRTLMIRTNDEVKQPLYECKGPLSKIEALLPEKIFYRGHKDVLLNINYVQQPNKECKKLIMKIGEPLDISRRKLRILLPLIPKEEDRSCK